MVNRIPGASQANQQVRLVSVTREKKQSEVKYCKLEEPASTAVAASDSPRSPKPASNDNVMNHFFGKLKNWKKYAQN